MELESLQDRRLDRRDIRSRDEPVASDEDVNPAYDVSVEICVDGDELRLVGSNPVSFDRNELSRKYLVECMFPVLDWVGKWKDMCKNHVFSKKGTTVQRCFVPSGIFRVSTTLEPRAASILIFNRSTRKPRILLFAPSISKRSALLADAGMIP